MRAAFPFILIFLALFAAGCIAYIAWELSSDKKHARSPEKDSNDADAQ